MHTIDVPGIGQLTFDSDREVAAILRAVHAAIKAGEPGIWLRAPANAILWLPVGTPLAFGFEVRGDFAPEGESLLVSYE